MNENQNANMNRKEYNKLQAEQIGNSSSVFDGKEFLLRLASIELPSGSTTIWDLPNGYIFKDENGNVINAMKIVLEKKKNEYPKSYEECVKCIKSVKEAIDRAALLCKLERLLVCRDAYWKIAGEEMRLDKPWEPDWTSLDYKYTIHSKRGKIVKGVGIDRDTILTFPTAVMRDLFYENFKELINECKELL